MERGILLETLANQLPAGAIRFSSKLAKIDKSESGETLLKLTDGTQLYAKVAYITSHSFLFYKTIRWAFSTDQKRKFFCRLLLAVMGSVPQ